MLLFVEIQESDTWPSASHVPVHLQKHSGQNSEAQRGQIRSQGHAVCQVAGHSYPSDLHTCSARLSERNLTGGLRSYLTESPQGEEPRSSLRHVMYTMNHHSHFLAETDVHR